MLQQSTHSALAFEPQLDSADDKPDPPIAARSPAPQIQPPHVPHRSVFAAIERLEEIILDSPRVPLIGKIVVDEEELLEQIDLLRSNLPEIIATAKEIVQFKDLLMREAQQQVQQILAEANQHAYQVANELGIVDRAEQEARQIRQLAIAECEDLKQQTIVEIEQLRAYHIQEIERMRENVRLECQHIQAGADEYADRVLHDMEDRLTDAIHTVQRGRQHLTLDS
ncbi:DivIVA domain-containing protein [Chamaesiphon sp.]|uniref:DivIVA domain-containing protein n=1 Tax=Chamaesiphon sp. TaxID=2814140 RepID=UPI00359415B9